MFFSEDAKTAQMCLMSLSTVCEGSSAYDMAKTSVQDEVANCTGKLLQGTVQVYYYRELYRYVTTGNCTGKFLQGTKQNLTVTLRRNIV